LKRELDVSDQKQMLGYAAGFQLAKTLLSINSPFDREAFALGVQDALSNQTPKLEKTELEQVDSQQLGQLNLEAIKQTMLKQWVGCAEQSEAHQSRTMRLLPSAASYIYSFPSAA
jgi:hypothetical protein